MFNHVSILFNQLQAKQLNISKVKSHLNNFNQSLLKTKNEFEEKEAHEVIDMIVKDVTARLEFKGHLITESLFDCNNFLEFENNFPLEALEIAIASYPFIDKVQLKNELEIIYVRTDFRDLSVRQLYTFIQENNLANILTESFAVLQILLTIPMTTVDAERQFSTLKRIKTDLRNRMGEDRLNALASITTNKLFFNGEQRFND